MPAYIYLAASGVIASVFILRWALVGDRGRSSSLARRNLGVSNSRARTDPMRRPSRLVRMVERLPIVGNNEAQQRRISAAGLPWTSAGVGFFRLVTFATSVLLGGLLGAALGSAKVFLLFAAVGAVLSLVPDYVIRSKGQQRQRILEEHLPDILDRLKVSLEAGLGFDSALANVVRGRSGPAYDEFKRVLQDLQLGMPRDEALQAMSDRTTITDLRIVLAAVLQSGKYGLPLVEVLRIQTEELRDKRWQRAQEQALKVPVKMIFPLILCIMPTFFIILVGPSIIGISRSF